MNYWLAQFILAARNRDEDGGWMQILFILVVAVFYSIGSIIKAATNKAAPKKQAKQIPRKPVHKPQGGKDTQMHRQQQKPWRPERPKPKPEPVSQPRPAAVKPQVRPPSRKVVRPQPSARKKLPTETEKTVKLPTFEVKPKLRKVSGLKSEAEAATAIEVPQTEYLSEILSDYEDPERLRRAILHYEILGKPVSLRRLSEQIGGF